MQAEEKTNSQYLSRSNSECLKGIFAVCVLMHHLYQYSGILRGTIIAYIFESMGYLSVSVFFFISGYGLMASYSTKGNHYIKQFPRTRLLPYYCVIVFLIVIYTIENIILKNEITMISVVKSLISSDTVVFFGWYLQVQLLLYIIFLIVFSICKTQKLQLGFLFTYVMVYCAVSFLSGVTATAYESVFSFVLGFVWYAKKARIDSLLRDGKRWLWLVVSTLFLVYGLVSLSFCNISSIVIVICKMLSAVLFVVLVMLLVNKIRVDYRLTRLLGTMSLDIYVVQGLFIVLLRSKLIYISNPYFYIVLVIIGTAVGAVLIHPIIRYIYKMCGRKMVQSQTVSA